MDLQPTPTPTAQIQIIDEYQISRPAGLTFLKQGTWLVSISPDGKITFNRDAFPDYNASDFSREFVNVLEASRLCECMDPE